MSINNTIGKIFDFIPETNLIEDYFYNHAGKYPLFSGQTKNRGIVAYIDSYNQDKPCVTFTTYGVNAGTLFYREGKFTIGRNCMGLRPKKQYEKDISLEWFSYKFQNLFFRRRIGDITGQRSLNKVLLSDFDITIPDKIIQEKQLKYYKRANKLYYKISKIRTELESLLESKRLIKRFKYKEQIKKFSELLVATVD